MARVIVVLDRKPEDKFEELYTASKIHDSELSSYPRYEWVVSKELPNDIDVFVSDQLSAFCRDAGEDACYMIVYGKPDD